jgi:uncharacterized membrane protein (DUF373 family)
MSAAEATGPGRDSDRPATPRWLLSGLGIAEDLIYVAVALVLIGVAGALLYRTVSDVLTGNQTFVVRITTAVNGALFVVIVLEIFRTVLAHLQGGGFQLRPFLVIGIISSVRHILLVGAQSLAGETGKSFDRSQIELGVNAAVALTLVVALVLVQRSGNSSDIDDEPERRSSATE